VTIGGYAPAPPAVLFPSQFPGLYYINP